MSNNQLLENVKFLRKFLFRLLHKAKLTYLIMIFVISLGISGWSIESSALRIPIIGFHDIIDAQKTADLPPRRPAFENRQVSTHTRATPGSKTNYDYL